MDVREKLVGLIEKASYECDEGTRDLWDMLQVADGIADFLIANGVTVQDNTEISEELLKQLRNAPITILQEEPTVEVVQEWISVKDRLPEHGDVVLCFMKFGEHRILQWDNVSSWWLGYGRGNDWQKSDVTHWSKMPQPPKGE